MILFFLLDSVKMKQHTAAKEDVFKEVGLLTKVMS